MKDMNSVYMSTCMKALCRHVKQNKLQGGTGEQGNRGSKGLSGYHTARNDHH